MQNTSMTDPALQSGFIGITRNADEIISRKDVNAALCRHLSCDWGDVSNSDWKSNDEAFKCGDRILSSYEDSNNIKFWIITEADRSATTVLLPEDY